MTSDMWHLRKTLLT